MELTNYFPMEEISKKNLAIVQGDKNSSLEYNSAAVIDFVKNQPNQVDLMLNDIFSALDGGGSSE